MTPEQDAVEIELSIEWFLDLLDGCDDDDTVRAGFLMEWFHDTYEPDDPPYEPLPEDTTAGEVRAWLRDDRASLARGEPIWSTEEE